MFQRAQTCSFTPLIFMRTRRNVCRTSMLQTSQAQGGQATWLHSSSWKKIRGLQWTTRSACASVAGSEEISPRVASAGSPADLVLPLPRAWPLNTALLSQHCCRRLSGQRLRTQPPSSCLSGLCRLSQGSSQAAEDSQPLDRSSLPLAPSSLHLPEHPARSYGAGQRPGGQHVQNGRLGMVECWCEPSCVVVFKRTLTTLRLLGKPMGSGSGSAQVGDAKRLWVPSRG